jgi:hypothetical protein
MLSLKRWKKNKATGQFTNEVELARAFEGVSCKLPTLAGAEVTRRR